MPDADNAKAPPRRAFRIMNNSMVCIGGEFIYSVINFMTSIIIARALGNEQYGYWSFIFVYVSFFEMFTRFGLNAILSKHLAQDFSDAPRLLGNVLIIRTGLTLLALPIAISLIWFLDYPLKVKAGVLIGSMILFLSLRSIFETLFRVKLLAFKPALWNVIRAALNLLLVFAISRNESDLMLFISASLLSGLVGLAGIAWDTYKICQVSLKIDLKLIKTLTIESLPLIFSGYLTLFYYRIDVFMLTYIDGFESVGYYSVATRLTEAFCLISSSLMLSVFPLLARAYKDNRHDFESLVLKTFKVLFVVGLPIAVGGSLCSRDIIVALFGETYSPSGTTLAILVWFTFVGFVTTFLVNLLIICGKAVVDTWISLILVFANIAMNFVLIPRFGFNGAAIATVMVEVAGFFVMMVYLVRHSRIRLPLPFKEFGCAVKVNLLFLAIIAPVRLFYPMHVFLFVLFGVVVYGALLFVMRAVKLSDFRDYMANGITNFIPAHSSAEDINV